MKKWTLKQQGIGEIIGLAIQFILGMSTNLFVKFPNGGSEASNWEFAKTQPVFWAHLLLGWVLFVNATVLLVRALIKKDKVWKTPGGVGFASITIALIAGTLFTGNQNDSLSMLMAVGFIIALLSYSWGIYSSK